MFSHRFEDFDGFESMVRNVSCRMMIQNPQDLLWTVEGINVAGLEAQFGRLGSGNIVQGQSWSNGVFFYFPLTETVEYSINGSVVAKHAVGVLEPGCDFCISTKFAHDWCSLFVPNGILACDNGAPDVSSSQSFTEAKCGYVTSANSQIMNRITSVLRQILTLSKNCTDFENSPAAESASLELRALAASLVSNSHRQQPPQEGRPKIERTAIIQRCMDPIEAHAEQNVSAAKLAASARVSERTLRAAFNEYFGIGPCQYLKIRTLNAVNHRLQLANPTYTTVSDVLVDQGVWEFGRFASNYRKLFGELPSQTLKKSLSDVSTRGTDLRFS
jgi:AraC family ethanolamine operon transcriptional activator